MVLDLAGSLSRVEDALRALHKAGKAGKTIANYAEALTAFCDWCVQRSYLEHDPLQHFRGFDTTPKTQRRALTVDEINRLLRVAAPHRRLLWETALFTGLRRNELRHLSIDHLDVECDGLHLEAAWTKNRKDGFLPLPRHLVEQLRNFPDEALAHYHRVYKTIPSYVPECPLLFVIRETARELEKDLQTAGIPKYTREGKIDFHALRVTYINMVIESGATIKEAQALAQHTTPHMTMNIYGRTREERLSHTIEKIAERVTCVSSTDSNGIQPIEKTNVSSHDRGGSYPAHL